MRKILAAAGAAGMLAASVALAGPAVAGGVPTPNTSGGGCPTGDGWYLSSVAAAIEALDNGNFKDNNGDGLGCYKVNAGQTAKNVVESWTWKDNTNPVA